MVFVLISSLTIIVTIHKNWQGLIASADPDMHEAKKAGRNQTKTALNLI